MLPSLRHASHPPGSPLAASEVFEQASEAVRCDAILACGQLWRTRRAAPFMILVNWCEAVAQN
jgi:hypothetical protein